MPTRTVSLAHVQTNMLARRHGYKMGRVDTERMSTRVMYNVSVRYRPVMLLVRDPMSRCISGAHWPAIHVSVPIRGFGAGPHPAAVGRLLDFAQKSLEDRLWFARVVPAWHLFLSSQTCRRSWSSRLPLPTELAACLGVVVTVCVTADRLDFPQQSGCRGLSIVPVMATGGDTFCADVRRGCHAASGRGCSKMHMTAYCWQ